MKCYTQPTGVLSANSHLFVDEESGDSVIFDVGGFDEGLQNLLSKIDESKLKYIILTHCHYDHIAGAEELRRRTGATVLISDADKTGLYDEEYSLALQFGLPLNKCTDFKTLADGDEIPFAGDTIKVIATPGHTSGGLCFIFKDWLITGDTLFAGSIGRTDFKNSDPFEMMKSLQKLKALDKNYTVLSGHGQSTTLDDEKKYNQYLR